MEVLKSLPDLRVNTLVLDKNLRSPGLLPNLHIICPGCKTQLFRDKWNPASSKWIRGKQICWLNFELHKQKSNVTLLTLSYQIVNKSKYNLSKNQLNDPRKPLVWSCLSEKGCDKRKYFFYQGSIPLPCKWNVVMAKDDCMAML